MDLGISLLMSCFNRTHLFERNYPTWLEDKTHPDEIIIVNDDGATDLVPVVEEMQKEYPNIPVTYKHRIKRDSDGTRHHRWTNPALVHNWLVKQAKGPIVLIIDPEIAFINDGLPLLYEYYQVETNRIHSCSAGMIWSVQHEFMHAVGLLTPEEIKNHPDQSTDPTSHQIIYRAGCPAHGHRSWWKERYIALGGKDERYTNWGWEDLDLAHRNRRLEPGPGLDHAHSGIEVVELGHPMPPASSGGPDSRSLWEQHSSPDGIANKDIEWGVIE